MKKCVVSLLVFLTSFAIGLCQTPSYSKTKVSGIKKLGTVNVGELEDPYLATLIHKEAPPVSGNSYKKYLADLKKELAVLHPKNDNISIFNRGDVNPPEIEAGFIVGGVQGGIPLDNHLAMFNDTIVSAINSHISVQSSSGAFIKNFTLAAFANGLNVNLDRLFDPRLLFDPIHQRYVAVFLGGFDSGDSNIIVCFSDSSDPTGDWHAYALTGNPNQDNTWTDYPMINFSETDVIVTVNLLRDNESWQLGFEESLIWQLDKSKGYAGEDLELILWDDINFGGAPIRNLCPVESGTEEALQNCFFLSNRNFDIENDTILILELTGGVNDPNTALNVDFIQADTPYGAPPNAEQQSNDGLQTNDARVLEAFVVGDQIQFVGNTRNLNNNKAGIYHGVLSDLYGTRSIALTHIIGEDYELGYPGIVYTGDGLDQREAIIAFNHSSPTKFAGVSAMYYVHEEGYSDIITVVDGTAPVQMLGSAYDYERWGDYLGTQRDYDNPDVAWISGFHTILNGRNHPYITALKKPQGSSSAKDLASPIVHKAYPNPMAERCTIEFDIPTGTKKIQIELLDANGRLIETLYSALVQKSGITEFSFVNAQLEKGMYYVQIKMDNSNSISKKILVQ